MGVTLPLLQKRKLRLGRASCSPDAGVRTGTHIVWLQVSGSPRHRAPTTQAALDCHQAGGRRDREGNWVPVASRTELALSAGPGTPSPPRRLRSESFTNRLFNHLFPPFLALFSQVLKLIIPRQKITSNPRNKSFRWQSSLSRCMCVSGTAGESVSGLSVIMGNI